MSTPASRGLAVRFQWPYEQDGSHTEYRGQLTQIIGENATVVTPDAKERTLPIGEILKVNPQLQKDVGQLRSRLEAALSSPEEGTEKLLINAAALHYEQVDSLYDNVKSYTIVAPTGRVLGQVALSTSPGGYAYLAEEHPKRDTNEDGAGVVGMEDGVILMACDGVGKLKGGALWTQTLMEEVANSPKDLLEAIQSTIKKLAESEGGTSFVIVIASEGKPLEFVRMGNGGLRVCDENGNLVYKLGSSQPTDRYHPNTGEFELNEPPSTHSAMEFLDLHAEELRLNHVAHLAERIQNALNEAGERMTTETAQLLAEKHIVERYTLNPVILEASLETVYARRKGLIEKLEKANRKRMQDLLLATSRIKMDPSDEWIKGLSYCMNSIIMGRRPIVKRDGYFFRSAARIIYKALMKHTTDTDIDWRRVPGVILKRGYRIVMDTDGIGDNILPVDDDGDEMDVAIQAAQEAQKPPVLFVEEQCQIMDDRILEANLETPGAVANAYKGSDNATLLDYRVGF